MWPKLRRACRRPWMFCPGQSLTFLPGVIKKLRAVMGDGCPALQRGLRHLQAVYPSIVFVGRDAAHVVRKSCQEAWVGELNFEGCWEKIWNTKHSLIPTIQNSPVWLAELRCAQELVLSRDHQQGAGLKRIMNHFSFAKQRYESSAHPQMVNEWRGTGAGCEGRGAVAGHDAASRGIGWIGS